MADMSFADELMAQPAEFTYSILSVCLAKQESLMRRTVIHHVGLACCLLSLTASLLHAQGPPLKGPSSSNPLADFLKQEPVPGPVLLPQEPPRDNNLEPMISPNTGMPVAAATQAPDSSFLPLAELALQSSEYFDPRYIAHSQGNHGAWREQIREAYQDQLYRLITSDFKNLYWSENTLYMGLAVGAMAPIANTNVDQQFRNWYQGQNGNSTRTTDFALGVKNLGEYYYMVPALAAISLGGHFFPDHEPAAIVADFGDRSLRAMAIGAPMVAMLQYGLGSDRPYTMDSSWHPFRSSHGASGHAFVGAVPFLTAASMTDSRMLQALFVAGSFATGWSRIQTDDHYLSQVILGWTVAWLAVRSVNQTEDALGSRVQFLPLAMPNGGAGVGVLMTY